MIELDRAIRALRDEKRPPDTAPRLEVEIFPDGKPREIATVYLVNGECPLACIYCALYRQTTGRPATGSEIAAQIRNARRNHPGISGMKLYNASSLFEPRSIVQTEDTLREIASALSGLDLVVVEARSENARAAVSFSRLLDARLEVAIGFETRDDELLRFLNKPTSLARFREAARFLSDAGILLRAFVLVGPPFVAHARARRLALASFQEARKAGARVVALLPVVSAHRPMEALRRAGFFSEISLDEYFETVRSCAAPAREGDFHPCLVVAETEFLDRLPGCPACRPEKARALAALNATGRIDAVECRAHRASPPVSVRQPRIEEAVASLLRSRP